MACFEGFWGRQHGLDTFRGHSGGSGDISSHFWAVVCGPKWSEQGIHELSTEVSTMTCWCIRQNRVQDKQGVTGNKQGCGGRARGVGSKWGIDGEWGVLQGLDSVVGDMTGVHDTGSSIITHLQGV